MNKSILGVVVIIEVLLLTTPAEAVITFERTYGGDDCDEGSSVQETQDGGYIIAGTTSSFGAGSYDVYLIKTDAAGDTLWTQTFGGMDAERGNSVQETQDGGFIIAGCTGSFGIGQNDVYLIRTDAAGDTVWTKTYGGTNTDYGSFVQETRDGGFIITGSTYSFGDGYCEEVYLIKTDAAGDTVWTKTYGGTNTDYCGSSVQETQDGGYVIAGWTGSINSDYSTVYLLKTDVAGNTVWTKTYGDTGWDDGNSVQVTQDGGFIIAGSTLSFGAGSTDVYLIKTNAAGDTLWTKTYGDAYSGLSVQETQDGGYIIAGYTWDFDYDQDVYLIKTNAAGDTLWTKTYGGTDSDYGYSVQETQDGGFIIAGTTRSFGAGSADIYLIKTDAQGNTGS